MQSALALVPLPFATPEAAPAASILSDPAVTASFGDDFQAAILEDTPKDPSEGDLVPTAAWPARVVVVAVPGWTINAEVTPDGATSDDVRAGAVPGDGAADPGVVGGAVTGDETGVAQVAQQTGMLAGQALPGGGAGVALQAPVQDETMPGGTFAGGTTVTPPAVSDPALPGKAVLPEAAGPDASGHAVGAAPAAGRLVPEDGPAGRPATASGQPAAVLPGGDVALVPVPAAFAAPGTGSPPVAAIGPQPRAPAPVRQPGPVAVAGPVPRSAPLPFPPAEAPVTALVPAGSADKSGWGDAALAASRGPIAGAEGADPVASGGADDPSPRQEMTSRPDKPPVTGGVWERIFVDLADQTAEDAAAPDGSFRRAPAPGQPDAARGPEGAVSPSVAVGGTLAMAVGLAVPADGNWGGFADRVMERGMSGTATSPRRAPEAAAPGPSTALPPQIALSVWTDDLSGRTGPDDPGVASLPGLPARPGSSPSAASAAPVSLAAQPVATQIAAVLVRGAGEATELALAPEELGRVRVRLEPDARNPDRMTILISVERPETLDLFRRHAGELAEAIRAAGYSGADIGFGQQGQGQSGRSDHPTGPVLAASALLADDPPATPTPPRPVAGTSLDLRL